MDFKNFTELTESLDVVAPFYMGQDTKLPERAVVIMNYDGAEYVMDIQKATKEGLYTMDLGLIVAKNKGYFRFKNSSHIKPILNTVIKALQSTIPFLGMNIKGLAISLPAKVSKSYVNLMKLLIQKTFLRQQFDFLPIEHVGASHQFLVLCRKNIDPKQIFKTKTFKDYDFSSDYTKAKIIPSDAVDDVYVHPLKHYSMHIDTTPSVKFKFKVDNKGVEFDVKDTHISNIEKVVADKPVIDHKNTTAVVPVSTTVAVSKQAPHDHSILTKHHEKNLKAFKNIDIDHVSIYQAKEYFFKNYDSFDKNFMLKRNLALMLDDVFYQMTDEGKNSISSEYLIRDWIYYSHGKETNTPDEWILGYASFINNLTKSLPFLKQDASNPNEVAKKKAHKFLVTIHFFDFYLFSGAMIKQDPTWPVVDIVKWCVFNFSDALDFWRTNIFDETEYSNVSMPEPEIVPEPEEEKPDLEQMKVDIQQAKAANKIKISKDILSDKLVMIASEETKKQLQNWLAVGFGWKIMEKFRGNEQGFIDMYAADYDTWEYTRTMLSNWSNSHNNFRIEAIERFPDKDAFNIVMDAVQNFTDSGFCQGEFTDVYTEPYVRDIFKWAHFKFFKHYYTEIPNYKKKIVEPVMSMKKGEIIATSYGPKKGEILDHKSVDLEIPFDTFDIQKDVLSKVNDRLEPKLENGAIYHMGDLYYYEFQEDASYKHFQKTYDEWQLGSKDEYFAIKSYTGTSYSTMNGGLRETWKNKNYFMGGTTNEKLNAMKKAFSQLKPLEKGVWVWRNADVKDLDPPDKVYKVNENIIDAGFLSTSFRHDIMDEDTYKSKNTRFMIYLPAGTVCLPIMISSSSSHETEIILPAASILRPFEVKVLSPDDKYSRARQYVKCVYTGNAMESFFDKHVNKTVDETVYHRSFNEFLKENDMVKKNIKISDQEKQMTPQQIKDAKYDFPGGSYEDSKKIDQMIKDGILKVEKK